MGEFEGDYADPVATVWITTKNTKTDRWIPKLVGQYEGFDDISLGGMSDDGKHLILYFPPSGWNLTQHSLTIPPNLTFLELQSNGKYKTLNSIVFDMTIETNMIWMNPSGQTAMVSNAWSEGVSGHAIRTYVRVQHAWHMAKVQYGLLLTSISRDGKTAFSRHVQWSPFQYTFRRIFVLKNTEWVLQVADLVGSGGPSPAYYQGSEHSTFSPNGNVFISGSSVHLSGEDWAPEDSGAYVFVRSNNGNWTQQGPRLGGGNVVDGAYTGISNDLKTIMLTKEGSYDNEAGFMIFKKKGPTWTQAGGTTWTGARGSLLNAKGNKVVTIWPPSVWIC